MHFGVYRRGHASLSTWQPRLLMPGGRAFSHCYELVC